MEKPQHLFEVELQLLTEACATSIRSHAETLTRRFGIDPASAYQTLVERLRDADNGLCADGRAGWWRVRCRLYDPGDSYKEAIADSDPEFAADYPGATVLSSLPAVIEWVQGLATTYHDGKVVIGLDKVGTASKIKTLRTQMSSRKNGTGLLILEYRVPGSSRIRQEMLHMRARVDITREAKAIGATLRNIDKTLANPITDS